MNRGDVWQLDLGGRAGKRPAVILTSQGVIPHLYSTTTEIEDPCSVRLIPRPSAL